MSNINVALIGNPNAGKSSIFNDLTGLRQKTGNFPGVTVEKKTGKIELEGKIFNLIDLPGTYSLFPNSKDEKLVGNILCNPANESYPDLVIYIADINHLERHLLLASQIMDLGLPIVIVLNMIDLFESYGNTLMVEPLKEYFEVPIIVTNARTGQGIEEIKAELKHFMHNGNERFLKKEAIYSFTSTENKVSKSVQKTINTVNGYQAKLIAHHHKWLDFFERG